MIILILLLAQIDTTGTAEVREIIPSGKTNIIHIRDWHFVTKKNYAADTGLEGDELENDYETFLTQVKSVQKSQRVILKDHKTVYVEGLKKSDMPIFEAMIKVQKKFPDDETSLKLGAAGQLRCEGKIKIQPAEGEDFEQANPVKDGKVEIDEKLNEAREDEIVKNLVKRKGTIILILGGAHDLSDNIKRLSKDCGYTLVTPKGYPED